MSHMIKLLVCFIYYTKNTKKLTKMTVFASWKKMLLIWFKKGGRNLVYQSSKFDKCERVHLRGRKGKISSKWLFTVLVKNVILSKDKLQQRQLNS